MKLVIIGAAGFIGSYLTKFFSISHQVVPIYRGDLDLLDYKKVHEFLTHVSADVLINAYSAGGKSRSREASLDIMAENLIAFNNFRTNKHLFGKYINIGSGAEFNKQGICCEDDILTCVPPTSYGLSKNLISRMCLQEPNFFTLRLFGCFGVGEAEFRLFTKFMSGKDVMHIDDKYFDNISVSDFTNIVNEYVTNTPAHKDINCVYSKKLLVSEQLQLLSEVTGHSRPLDLNRGVDYIGSSDRLTSLGIPLSNLSFEMEQYKCQKLSM